MVTPLLLPFLAACASAPSVVGMTPNEPTTDDPATTTPPDDSAAPDTDTNGAEDTGDTAAPLEPVLVALEVMDDQVFEGGVDPGALRLALEAPATADVVVSLQWHGSATLDEDYRVSCSGTCTADSATIPAGETSLTLTITPIVTADLEVPEQATLTVQPSDTVLPDASAEAGTVMLYEHGPSSGAVYYLSADGSDDSSGDKAAPFASLDHAASVLTPGDTLYVTDGTYTHASFTEDHGEDGDSGLSRGVLAKVGVSGTADAWITIAAEPDGNDVRPLFRFDGSGGIQFSSGASYVLLDGLEIEGPSATIAYDWAHEHRWSKENYYIGRGIFSWGPVHHIVIRNCHVHHTPGSGIRFNSSDYIQIEGNVVANTTWWSSSAESAVVVATAQSIDKEDAVKFLYAGNWVYNNWNFLEFCDSDYEGSTEDTYGNCDAYTGGIIDGQGLYVTRNNDTYAHGRMRFENNIAFNNGFGGVVYHKTDRGELVNNLVFMNGAYPGITNYSGLSVNTVDDLFIANNLIWARESDDYALKDNGNATNVVATHNTIIGITQFGEDTENIILAFDKAVRSDFFSDVDDLSGSHPDPSLTVGDTSPAEIDAHVMSLIRDLRPPSASPYLWDLGTDSRAPGMDIEGVLRPQEQAIDIGAYELQEAE